MKVHRHFALGLVLGACDGTSSIGRGDLGAGAAPATGVNWVGTGDTPAASSTGTSSNGNVNVGGSGAVSVAECSTTILASENNDYHVSETFTLASTHVKPNSDLTFDWSGVTRDLAGNELDPRADVQVLSLMLVSGGPENTAQTLQHNGGLSSNEVSWQLVFATEGSRTQAHVTEFSPSGTPALPGNNILDYFDAATFRPNYFSYLLALGTSTVIGRNTRMLASFVLDFASENTTVTLDSSSTTLEYAADLTGLTAPRVPWLTPHLLFDYRHISTYANGRPFDSLLSEVKVYEHSLTFPDVIGHLPNLDAVADHVWRAPVVGGGTLDLATLSDGAAAFPGTDTGQHGWLLAIYAEQLSPLPIYLTILSPCTP